MKKLDASLQTNIDIVTNHFLSKNFFKFPAKKQGVYILKIVSLFEVARTKKEDFLEYLYQLK